MGVLFNQRERFIIDRTIPEIIENNQNVQSKDLSIFCGMLHQLGVDLIEINRVALERLEKLPENFGFIYRIESIEDMEICVKYGFEYCVINYDIFLYDQAKLISELKDTHITLEIGIEHIEKEYGLTHLKNFITFNHIDCIRVHELSKILVPANEDIISRIKNNIKAKVDILPDNRFFQATAVAVEGIMHDVDFITAAFTGKCGQYGTAALEEVIMGLRVIMKLEVDGDTTLLPQLCARYKMLTNASIEGNKAILGQDIFKYESGIHADGIEKNPKNYEPYEPEEVGQKRKLVLGKHSGTRAVISKLKEMGIDHETVGVSSVLEMVRAKSVMLGRGIHDYELIQLCNQCMTESLDQAI
ncbi:homocitrate synthase [Petroclostridium sp. X23]|uniref:homocitrate synthase/isopropylmalate synthase family protein n=1 Tax=Petroclostridium sp. X23 TaxID=3045146 RepID=UPI0024AD4CEF|nr:homocitrate synthase [Petroclostridium sp. X23]WHH56958.1 homocitrate synthase [Petroclostridium sp. X23]